MRFKHLCGVTECTLSQTNWPSCLLRVAWFFLFELGSRGGGLHGRLIGIRKGPFQANEFNLLATGI